MTFHLAHIVLFIYLHLIVLWALGNVLCPLFSLSYLIWYTLSSCTYIPRLSCTTGIFRLLDIPTYPRLSRSQYLACYALCFLCLILSGVHYRLVLIFCVYLVLPAFSAYWTFLLT